MSIKKPLLIEVGVEELPAIPLIKILDQIEKSWKSILERYRLKSSFNFYYTPRRLVLEHKGIPIKQPNSTIEFFGPPKDIAVRDGIITKAGEGFAKRCGVEFSEIKTVKRGDREVLYYKREERGRDTESILEEMLKEWIGSMNFGKSMRWGDNSFEFIRPVRWLQVRLGDKIVNIELFGIKSSNRTHLHRMVSFDSVEVSDISEYKSILLNGKVVLSQIEREQIVLESLEQIEREHNVKIERDKALLKEVVAITENPKALLGRFDKQFLELPKEVIIASMKEHQRYFPVFKNGELDSSFVFVSNGVTDDYSKIIKGNERVLKPRLSDALFFYHNDLKRGLITNGLESITFIDGLGSLIDKIEREKYIAKELATLYIDRLREETKRDKSELLELIEEAITLAKADLTTEMVYEFTELQGVMGYYYAKALGKDRLVCSAIKEQYYPVGENSPLPSSLFSAIIAISIKLDTLIGLFSIGKIPTGSKDPFALRRAVNGIIRVVERFDLEFNIDNILNRTSNLYREYNREQLKNFILERLKKALRVNPSIITAVLSSGERDINRIIKKVKALNSRVTKDKFSIFKRVANISKDIDLEKELIVDISLFKRDIERELYTKYLEIISKDYSGYGEKLEALFGLGELLNRYFDEVLVHSEDIALRANRQNTIALIYKAFLDIADIKYISL